MFIRQHRFPLLSALLVSALIVAHLLIVWQKQTEAARPFGRYTLEQVLGRTEPLCRALAPQAGRLRLSAQRIRSEYTRIPWSRWEVECADEAGRPLAHFNWEADTGSLLYVKRLGAEPTVHGTRSLNQEEAVEVSRVWLRVLGMTDGSSHWRMNGAPKRSRDVWFTSRRSEERGAFIRIDARTGDFLQAESWRLSPAS